MSSTSGVRTRHMVSLTKNAENLPHTVTIAASNTKGPCAFFMTHSVTSAKMPESRKFATTIIMPNSMMIGVADLRLSPAHAEKAREAQGAHDGQPSFRPAERRA